MKRVKITVTKKDIQLGERGNGMRCPIAKAAQRVLKGIVCVEHAWLDFEDELGEFDLPKKAVRFIQDFDAGEPVKPFQFSLWIKEEYVR